MGYRNLKEEAREGDDTPFNEWSFREDLSSNGLGGSVKVGMIYHASPVVRIGAAFHSPTIYSIDEAWQTQTESKINLITRKYVSPESNYEYTFISPLKWVGSLAFVIGYQGLISLDAEYINYGAAQFRANDWDYSDVNQSIKATLFIDILLCGILIDKFLQFGDIKSRCFCKSINLMVALALLVVKNVVIDGLSWA